MTFADPAWLWCLLAWPIFLLADRLSRFRRRFGWRSIAQSGEPPTDGRLGWTLAVLILMVALARPQWGIVDSSKLAEGRDLVLLIDVSQSMAAEDVVPNRLGRSLEAALELVNAIGTEPGDRVGLVAFAGRGVVRCPITENLGAVIGALRALEPGMIDLPGTNLGAGLETALSLFDGPELEGGRALILISDGEDHKSPWLDRIEQLRASGVALHAVAVGDAKIPHEVLVTTEDGRSKVPLRFKGAVVRSRRDDSALRALAIGTGGAFVPLGVSDGDLGQLFEEYIAPASRRFRESTGQQQRIDQFPLFLVVAMMVGVVGSWPRRFRSSDWRRSRLLFLLTVLCLGASKEQRDARPVALAIGDGLQLYRDGDLEGALQRFQAAASIEPNAPLPHYNSASVLFQLGRFAESREAYIKASATADPSLQMKIDFGLGNVAVALREIPDAIQHYDSCVSSEVLGDDYDRIRSDALENRRFAERLTALGAETANDHEAGGQVSESTQDQESRPAPDDAPQGNPEGQSPVTTAPEMEEPRTVDPIDSRESESRGSSSTESTQGFGSESQRAPARGQSPEERLSEALDAIREARERRPRDRPPPADSSGEQRPW